MLMKPKNIIELNNSKEKIFIDIGAGGPSKKQGYISLDIADCKGVDIVGDAFQTLRQIDTDQVDGIYSRHFLEHVEDISALVKEMTRICKNGARIEIIVPHFSNPFFYSDVTHRRFFGLYSFSYLAKSVVGFKRTNPNYARIPCLIQENVDLIFRSYKPRYIRYAIKKVFQFIFNSSNYMKELYEEIFSWLIPCYEVRYLLRVDKEQLGT